MNYLSMWFKSAPCANLGSLCILSSLYDRIISHIGIFSCLIIWLGSKLTDILFTRSGVYVNHLIKQFIIKFLAHKAYSLFLLSLHMCLNYINYSNRTFLEFLTWRLSSILTIALITHVRLWHDKNHRKVDFLIFLTVYHILHVSLSISGN